MVQEQEVVCTQGGVPGPGSALPVHHHPGYTSVHTPPTSAVLIHLQETPREEESCLSKTSLS